MTYAAVKYDTVFHAGIEELKDVEQVEESENGKRRQQSVERKKETKAQNDETHRRPKELQIHQMRVRLYQQVRGRCVCYKWMQRSEVKQHQLKWGDTSWGT